MAEEKMQTVTKLFMTFCRKESAVELTNLHFKTDLPGFSVESRMSKAQQSGKRLL